MGNRRWQRRSAVVTVRLAVGVVPLLLLLLLLFLSSVIGRPVHPDVGRIPLCLSPVGSARRTVWSITVEDGVRRRGGRVSVHVSATAGPPFFPRRDRGGGGGRGGHGRGGRTDAQRRRQRKD